MLLGQNDKLTLKYAINIAITTALKSYKVSKINGRHINKTFGLKNLKMNKHYCTSVSFYMLRHWLDLY